MNTRVFLHKPLSAKLRTIICQGWGQKFNLTAVPDHVTTTSARGTWVAGRMQVLITQLFFPSTEPESKTQFLHQRSTKPATNALIF